MSARFAVRRAELDVRQNELISAIDARKNELTLEEAKRRLQRLESDIESRLQQREAELTVLREEIRKAELEVAQDRRRIENARVLTPMGGLVSTLENRSGRRSFGQSAPPVQEGDQVSPGMSIVQILDLSEMELVAKGGGSRTGAVAGRPGSRDPPRRPPGTPSPRKDQAAWQYSLR